MRRWGFLYLFIYLLATWGEELGRPSGGRGVGRISMNAEENRQGQTITLRTSYSRDMLSGNSKGKSTHTYMLSGKSIFLKHFMAARCSDFSSSWVILDRDSAVRL
jgi:hypothetical protein